jgi:hypothetical protein
MDDALAATAEDMGELQELYDKGSISAKAFNK